MDNVVIGEGAVVRRAIIDKNVVVAPGVALTMMVLSLFLDSSYCLHGRPGRRPRSCR